MATGAKGGGNNLFINKLLIACIVAGLAAALYIGFQRHQVEVSSNTVELVLDYEDVVDLAAIEGVTVTDLMRQLREAGITSLAVYDMTLEKLNKSGLVFSLAGAELLQRYQTGVPADPAIARLLQAGKISADRVYVFGPNTQTFQEVREDLMRRLGPGRVLEVSAGSAPVLEVRGNYEKLVKWNLGLSTTEMSTVAQNGFFVVPRPTNYAHVSAEDVDAVFGRILMQPKTSTLFFVGEEVLGYKPQIARTAEYLNKHDIVLGLIEHPLQLQFLKQEGLTDLAKAVDYRAARVYVIPKEEQLKMKMRDAVERWAISDRERNIRINLMRIFTKPEGDMSLIDTNLTYVRETKKTLGEADFSFGQAGTFQTYRPSRFALALITLGACAGGVLLLGELMALSSLLRALLLIVAFLPLASTMLMGYGNVARQAVALGSAIIFPSLAMAWQMKKWRRVSCKDYAFAQVLWRGIKDVAQASLISLIGGLFIATVLGDVRYFLEIEIYRGVKLTFVLPLLIVIILFFRYFSLWEEAADSKGFIGQMRRILDQPVRFKYLVALAVAAVAAVIYVGRSGHTYGVPVPALELKMRALFEHLFYARPRTREFLIGHPAFLLANFAVYSAWSRVWQLALVVTAAMAQSSLVETFAHLRTPVIMSLIRGIDGWIMGVIIGMVAVLVLLGVMRVAVQLGRRTVGHG
jgi:hypothetical protein